MADGRFVHLSDEEKQIILDNVDAKNTKRGTATAVKCFTDYLNSRNEDIHFENLSTNELDSLLSDFYLEARNHKGEHYKKGTIMAYRHGLQRHIEAKRTTGRIDITKGEEFTSSKKAFKSMGKELKKEGKAVTNHHHVISDEDLDRAYTYLTDGHLEDATRLQLKVFLDIMLHFGRRGRENLADLTRKDFAVTTDENGSLYVYMTRDEQTKNHQDDNEKSSDGVMCEIKGSDRCPVKSFVKYMRRLNPLCQALFQLPRTEPIEGIYYDCRKLGHNKLGLLMSNISERAGLSMKYTNHSCRATTVNVLDRAQIPSRHIMSVTGHKCESSLKTYSGKTDRATLKIMSGKIADKIKEKSCSTSGLNIDKNDSENIENIDLQNLEPLTNSQSHALIDDLQDFVQDGDNIDDFLMTIDTQQMSQHARANAVSNKVMNVQRRQMSHMPVPIFHNCQNIKINYNLS